VKRIKDRSRRIRVLADALLTRSIKRLKHLPLMMRKPVSLKPEKHALIAYDLETTNIAEGTPRPLYLTAYGDEGFFLSQRIRTIDHLGELIRHYFLTEEFIGARYIAWYGNYFDVYFIAAGLLQFPEYIIKPYLTKGNNLRGMRVILRGAVPEQSWEFLDGSAMTGIQKKLDKFLETFASDYRKLDAPNWEIEQFDYHNEKHVRYAERDSEGLYYAIKKAQAVVFDNFGLLLQPTIGNLGIKAFQANMPFGVKCSPGGRDLDDIVRKYVMRGGFCYAAKRYAGPIWKYDLNQAYAAAMRDAALPAGRPCMIRRFPDVPVPGIYLIVATAPAGGTLIPFYHRDVKGLPVFSFGDFEAYLTNIEISQLIAEGYRIKVFTGWWYDSCFSMTDYVNRLEDIRVNGPGGPKSAQGEMIKTIGNNSYGKTVEKLQGLDIVMALECPDGYAPFQDPDNKIQHLWCQFTEPAVRAYHQPQIGAFITAHVRMLVRRAALQAPEHWLYADTDCVVFDCPVDLPIDPGKYGYWKQESAGEFFRIITKKVYANEDASEKHAKGLNIKRLTAADFENWFNGEAPIQDQLQRQNFLKCMTGEEMFKARTRRGEVLNKKIDNRKTKE
jgi:hypothetical protein